MLCGSAPVAPRRAAQVLVMSTLLANASHVARFFCQDAAVATLTAALLPFTAINTIGAAGTWRPAGQAVALPQVALGHI